MQLLGRHFATGQSLSVQVVDGMITELQYVSTSEEVPYLAPGLFDIQINGYGGVWFGDADLTVEQVLSVLRAHYRHGITHLFPTLITNSFEALEYGFRIIRQACETEPCANHMVTGCHLEGPYLSAEDGPRGAHPVQHIRGCDWHEFEKLQKASGNRIRLLTLAPESIGAEQFIRQVTASGVTISIGHTAATTEQIEAAVNAGAKLSTHLGNGAHGTLRRHPNYIWDQLGEPRLMASIIADGHHLPASVVRSIYLAKGPQNIILTCDASGLAGCTPGVYDYHGAKFEVLDHGPIVIAGQRQFLAGSGVQTDVCIGEMMRMSGCSLRDAWNMATLNPSRLLNVSCAELKVGQPANLVMFTLDEHRVVVERTIANGVDVYGPHTGIAIN